MGNPGAMVCGEVADGRCAILYAERSEPVDEADSGWLFTCGSRQDDPALAQIWALEEVLEVEPSLRAYVGMPSGTVLERGSPDAPWATLNLA
jgi:hypothetical protein